jgi:hypothetical protein
MVMIYEQYYTGKDSRNKPTFTKLDRSPYQTDRLFIKDDIISLGVVVVSLELTTHSMMQWSLWHSETKTHIEHLGLAGTEGCSVSRVKQSR